MNEIKCPKCGTVFQIDESDYDSIVKQIRDKEFEKELERREKELESKQEKELEIIRMQEEKEYKLCDNVVLTQKDIREVQLAKAAIRAGIELLAEKLGVETGRDTQKGEAKSTPRLSACSTFTLC